MPGDNRPSKVSLNRRVTFADDQIMPEDINEQTQIDLSCVREMKKMFISEMDDSFLKLNLGHSRSEYYNVPKISITQAVELEFLNKRI